MHNANSIELVVQESAGWYTLDGNGAWSIFCAATFAEVLREAFRRGQLFWKGKKVLRFDTEENLCPVTEDGFDIALEVPGTGWSFYANA